MNDINPTDFINISPYNAGAFGGLIVVLVFIALYFKKSAEEKELHIRNIIDKTHEIQETLALKLNEISLHSKNKDERIIEILKEIKSKVDTIK